MKVRIFNSSAIKLAKSDNRTLTITFTSGGEYKYDDVPEDVVNAFWKADSAGQFYHRNIKGQYKWEKVR